MATATTSDLFLAFLALDAYNRNYNPGMTFSGLGGDQIGNATVVKQPVGWVEHFAKPIIRRACYRRSLRCAA
jgi:hypothetical protein